MVDLLELCKLKVILFKGTRRILQQRVCVYEVCGGGCSGTFAVKEKVKEPLFQTGESLAVFGVATTSVLRQLPRKSRIINAVRHAAVTPSLSTPLMAGSDEDRLIKELRNVQLRWKRGFDAREDVFDTPDDVQRRGVCALQHGQQSRANTVLRNDIRLDREPVPRTLATSRMYTLAPLTCLIGRSLSISKTCGLLFSRTLYSRSPSF